MRRLTARALTLAALLFFLGAGVVALGNGTQKWSLLLAALGLGSAVLVNHMRFQSLYRETRAVGATSLDTSGSHTELTRNLGRNMRAVHSSLRNLTAGQLAIDQRLSALEGSAHRIATESEDALHKESGAVISAVQTANRSTADAVTALSGSASDLDQKLGHVLLAQESLRQQIISLNNLVEQVPSTSGEYQALRNHLADPATPLPQLGSWALSAPVVIAIAKLILGAAVPMRILELGSGASSVWLSLALRQTQHGGRAYSLDHLPEYAEATRRNLAEAADPGLVEVLDAPLTPIALSGEEYYWYSLENLPTDATGINLLVIDGPPARKALKTRYPAFPVLKDLLADEAIIILDDTVREEEVKIYQQWIAENPGLTFTKSLGKAVQLQWQKPLT